MKIAAYLDTVSSGLVPCMVTSADLDCFGGVEWLHVKVTAPRPGYARGETLRTSPCFTVPRSAVMPFTKRHPCWRQISPYSWATLISA